MWSYSPLIIVALSQGAREPKRHTHSIIYNVSETLAATPRRRTFSYRIRGARGGNQVTSQTLYGHSEKELLSNRSPSQSAPQMYKHPNKGTQILPFAPARTAQAVPKPPHRTRLQHTSSPLLLRKRVPVSIPPKKKLYCSRDEAILVDELTYIAQHPEQYRFTCRPI